MSRGRVLIVSYYFPPAGGSGVHRVLKLCKYLPEFGWDVDVLAPDDAKWVAHDPTLEQDVPEGVVVHRARYIGPDHAQSGADKIAAAQGWHTVTARAAVASRRLLLPDAAAPWVPFAARTGIAAVRERGIDAVLTSSPPTSAHLIGNVISRRTGVPWVADFRDSWLANPHRRYERRTVRYKRSLLSGIARRTMAPAAALTAVTDVIREEAEGYMSRPVPSRTISNGCDFDDFAAYQHRGSAKLRLLHAGYFFGVRSPRPLLQAVRSLLDRRPALRDVLEVRFVGGFRPADREWAESLDLGPVMTVEGTLPHDQTLQAMKEADALVLLIPNASGIGRSVLSGKVFEYLAAERPILGLVPPDGAAADLLRSAGHDWIADPDDVNAITDTVERLVDAWIANRLGDVVIPPELRARLDRRARAEEMAAVLAEVTGRTAVGPVAMGAEL
ncbi:MAG TPA: glycosyltransferase [Gaiellales bacterium]|nr:glycosyltransferase [Gaiellales bacterium]